MLNVSWLQGKNCIPTTLSKFQPILRWWVKKCATFPGQLIWNDCTKGSFFCYRTMLQRKYENIITFMHLPNSSTSGANNWEMLISKGFCIGISAFSAVWNYADVSGMVDRHNIAYCRGLRLSIVLAMTKIIHSSKHQQSQLRQRDYSLLHYSSMFRQNLSLRNGSSEYERVHLQDVNFNISRDQGEQQQQQQHIRRSLQFFYRSTSSLRLVYG